MKNLRTGYAAFVAGLVLIFNLGSAQVKPETEGATPKMRQEIIKLNYIKDNEILNVLYTFLSREGRMIPNPSSGLIGVSDYPENVEKILSAVREYDVKPADVLFTVQLLLGSSAAETKADDSIKDDPVVKELKRLLNYKSFNLLDTAFIRAIDRETSGLIMGRNADLKLDLRPKHIKDEKGDLIQVEARLNKKEPMLKPVEPVQWTWTRVLESSFSLRPGEKTVVGVSKIDGGDKGLILIISGKIVS